MKFRLATIIVSFNSEATLRECITSVLEHAPKDQHCIIVVDNGSKDRSVEIARTFEPCITVAASEQNLGFGTANNLGMRMVDAEYYYLHNSDAYLEADSLTPALTYLDLHPETGIAGLPLVFPDHSPQTSAYSFSSPYKWALQLIQADKVLKWVLSKDLLKFTFNFVERLPMAKAFVHTHAIQGRVTKAVDMASDLPSAVEVDWVTGASLILRREVFRRTGGFDEGIFLYGEDEDLCLAVRSCGYGVRKIFSKPVIHEFGWGKNKKKKGYFKPKHDSLRYFINKHFAGKPLERLAMLFLLRCKFLGLRALLPWS